MTRTEMIIAIASKGFEVYQSWAMGENAMTLGIKLMAYPKRRKEGKMYQIDHNVSIPHLVHWTNPDAAMETIEEDLTKSLYKAMEKDEVFLKRI